MSRLTIITAAAAAALVAIPAAAQGNATPAPAAGTAATTGAEYMKMAGSSDLYERTSSQMVLKDAKNPQVRQFAQMMIDDHAKTTQSVTAAARKDRLALRPPTLVPEHARLVADLKAAPAASREQLYVQQQLQAHQQALVLHQGFASGGDKPALREAANSAVPIVQAHISQLRSMQTASR